MRVQDLKTGRKDFSLSILRCDIYPVVVEERREDGGRGGRASPLSEEMEEYESRGSWVAGCIEWPS